MSETTTAYSTAYEDPELQRLHILLQVVESMNSEGEVARALSYMVDRFGVGIISVEALKQVFPEGRARRG